MPAAKTIRGTQLNRTHPLARGLVGCWLMNEGCGNQIFDLSGNKNTGTFSGNTSWTAGQHGYCLSFDGVNDWVDISDDRLPAFGTNDFSVVFLAKHPRDDSHRDVLSKGSTGAGEISFYKHAEETFMVYGDNRSISVYWGDDSWPDNLWTHFAAVRSGIVLTLYQNGIKGRSDTSAGANINTDNDWRIGASGSGSGDYAGQVEYVMIYNRALSAAEIALLYCEPFCMFEPTISPVFGSYYIPPVGNIGIMTTWGGYWGVTY